MKTKYDSSIQRDILIVYAVAFLTIMGGILTWIVIQQATNPSSQQPTSSQVLNSQNRTNQNTLSPTNTEKANPIPLSEFTHSVHSQLGVKLKTSLN